MATISWVIFKHHKKADGTFNPKIRVTHNRTTSYLATNIYTPFVRFKRGSSTGTVSNGEVEDSLNDRVSIIRKIVNTNQEAIDNCDNAKELVEYIERYLNRQNLDIDFITFGREYLSTIQKEGTREAYTTGLNVLSYYLMAVNGAPQLPIKKLTSKFLMKYDAWLRTDRVFFINGKTRKAPAMGDNGVAKYMLAVQTIFNQAKNTYNDYEFDDIVIRGDPFKVYHIPETKRPPKRSLSKEHLLRVFNYNPPFDWRTDALACDLFKMSFMLAGMNAVDLYNCTTYKNGRIEYFRSKTTDRKSSGVAFMSIKVRPEIEPLLDKYRDKTGKRVFNFYQLYTNHKALNVALCRGFKYVSEATGIPKLQYYCARHSFATIARMKCKKSLDDVAFCLTHSSGHDITEIYVDPDYSLVDEVIDKVMEYVFKEEQE